MRSIGYQLYSSRNFPPLSDILKRLKTAGYGTVEGYGGLMGSPDSVEALKAGLAENGLSMPTCHFGLDMIEQTPQDVIAIAKALGIKAIFVPFLAPDDRPQDAAGWRAFGQRLDTAGAPLRDAGLSFGWHNHDFEFVDLDGSTPLDLILDGGPDLSVELDLAWVAVAGHDPMDWITRLGSRIHAVHIKDIAPAGTADDEDGWADVGHGTMDWATLLPAVTRARVQELVVEHDNPSDDHRFAERSIAGLRTFSEVLA